MGSFRLHQDYAEAVTLYDKGQHSEALRSCRAVLQQQPNDARTLNLLGLVLQATKDLSGAYQAFRDALMADPRCLDAQCNLAEVLLELDQFEEASAACETVIAVQPDFALGHSRLGKVLLKMGMFAEAIASHRRAVALDPLNPEFHFNFGVSLLATGARTDAIAEFRRSIELKPDHFEVYNNLSLALMEIGQIREAIAVQRQAIELYPTDASAQSNLGLLLLRVGDFAEGLEKLEWRLKIGDRPKYLQTTYRAPRWDGAPMDGVLLLDAEQGVGDTINFVRYAERAATQCKKIIVACQPELLRLFRHSFSAMTVVPTGGPLPHYDAYCLIPSLPYLFRTTLETIPGSVPYLNAYPADLQLWRQRLSDGSGKLNVGLVWAGNTQFPADLLRSPRVLSRLAPLGQVPGVRFISLQKGSPAKQTKNPPSGMEIVDWTDDLHDFAETAALIENLDLVISSCTSVPHLAGALGKPVWTIVPADCDWRWMRDRTDTPWYPTMRLFRQTAIGQWEPVVREVASALAQFSAKKGCET